jgi:hypothetical protein
MLDCYDDIVIGSGATVLAVVLSLGLHSSIGYIALGGGAYFLMVGFAGLDAMRGGMQIVAHAQGSAARRVRKSMLISALDESMTRNATRCAAHGIPVRMADVLNALAGELRLDAANTLLRDELALALERLCRDDILYSRNALLARRDFSYRAVAARCLYDKAMLEGTASLGASATALLNGNNVVPYCSINPKTLGRAMRSGRAIVAVPSAKARRLLLDLASTCCRAGALLGFGIASKTIEVKTCC